jgi:hypothetical protein
MHFFWREQCRLGFKIGRVGKLDFQGQASHWREERYRDGKKQTHPCRGQIILHLGRLGSGIVSHELTHAAIYQVLSDAGIHDKPFVMTRKLDEKIAWTQGWLTQQFWQAFYRRGLEKLV